ncbi:hypothetical protein V5P93_004858 [Actinokineospora auranticolor]|uniref:Uncharacterized protein n=1 Tax=Actinokineospora auranticolor TaxID=155976 RepID=A0A2S6GNR3_9PSEU|nr:hypothetical protein [Actinokineospora auranticolor]PPK66820.1 hypothetical protein CLV40_109205 [Actinokineospora auranticolor]
MAANGRFPAVTGVRRGAGGAHTLVGNPRVVVQAQSISGGIHYRGDPGGRGVLTHQERLARLSGLRDLTPDRLAFVGPGDDHPSHPARLFAALRGRADDRGVVLVGPAGAGKTRTCLEVAALAEQQGWRALHVLGGEQSVEQIVDAVLADSAPALVVIDYLSECRGLDHTDLRGWLIPAARAQGVRVAVLATARPGWMLLDDADPVHLEFETVELRADHEHLDAIRAAILDLEAPTACRLYTREWVERVCGRRPVIAMLVAREIEARARSGARPEDDPRRDLAGWLLSRLWEDGLVLPRPKRAFDRVEPDVGLQVAAAMVAACPQPREALERVAEGVLGDTETAGDDARQYVDTLLRMRWIEEDGPTLAVVHDIVVDQLLEQTMLSGPGDRVRRGVATAILAPAVDDARTMGRYATNLARLVRELGAKGRADDLAGFCGEWLADNAAAIGQTLLADTESGGYTLGTLLGGAPWATAALAGWPSLIGPWLAEHGRTAQARHLYFKGLAVASADRAAHLSDGAVLWLREHGARAGAGFVLSALLAKADLGAHSDAVVGTALDWVRRHWRRVDAQYVLTGVLGRRQDDLDAAVAVEHARRWLGEHGDRDDSRYVLNALLTRDDLGLATKEIIGCGLDWLARHRGPEGAMVLSVLLRRTDSAVPTGLEWLGAHGALPNAQYVLEQLLTARRLDGAQAEAVVRHGLLWLLDNLDRFAGGFLLQALLDGRDLGAHTGDTLDLAVVWLGRHGAERVAGAVLGRLVGRDDLGGRGQAVAAAAREWLGAHHESHTAGPLIACLLRRPDAGGVLAHGVAWLTANRKHPRSGSIAVALLRRPDLGGHRDTVTAHALRWLVGHRDHPAAPDMRVALGFPDRSGCGDLAGAVAWVGGHADVPATEVPLRHLLLHEDLGSDESTVVAHALAWLSANGLHPDAAALIDAILPRTTGTAAIEVALAWLAEHRLPGRALILRSLLTHPDLGARAPAAVALAVDWLGEEEDFLREPHLVVLKCLLDRPDLPARAHAAAVTWLDDHDGTSSTAQVLNLLVDRPDLGVWAEPVTVRSLAWVRANPGHAGASAVLSKLLTRPDLGPWAAHAMAYACTWIADSGHATRARFVIGRLLARPDLGPLAVRAVDQALRWLDHNEVYPKAWFVLIPLLDLPGAHRAAARAHARAWLAATTNDPGRRADIETRLARVH